MCKSLQRILKHNLLLSFVCCIVSGVNSQTIKCNVFGYERDTAVIKKVLAYYNFASDMDIPDLKNAVITITQANHHYCLFNSVKSDGLEVRFTVTKNSVTKEYTASRPDFYSEYMVSTISGSTVFAQPAFPFSDVDYNAPEGYTYYNADIYTRVLEQNDWTQKTLYHCDGFSSVRTMGSSSEKEYSVYGRRGPLDSSWKLIAKWTLDVNHDCDGNNYYYTNTPYGLGKRAENSMLHNLPARPFFSDMGECVHDILKASHELVPYPPDSVKGIFHGKNYNAKRRMLLDMLAASYEFRVTSADSLKGIWLDEVENTIYIIPGIEKSLLYKIPLSYESLFNPKGYQGKMETINTSEINGKGITITWVTRDRFGDIASDWKEYYTFTKITPEKIYLTRENVWKRISKL